MTKPYAEQVSALADGELSHSEMQLLVRQASGSNEVARRLGRYTVIREALHRNLPARVDFSLAERISRALDEESAHQGPVPVRSRRWVRPVAGVAVAASVASVALVAITIWPQQTTYPEADAVQAAGTAVQEQVAGQPVRAENIQWDRLDPDIQARLEEYAVTRGERAEPQLDILSRPVGVSGRRGDN